MRGSALCDPGLGSLPLLTETTRPSVQRARCEHWVGGRPQAAPGRDWVCRPRAPAPNPETWGCPH